MPQVTRQEDPIEACSVSGLWRSSLAQMEVYRDRPAPSCAFLICLALWSAALWRIWTPIAQDAEAAGVCLLRDVVFSPHASEWRRYLLHSLWPLESTYLRGVLTSVILLLQGYAMEYEVGTSQYAALLLGTQVAAAVLLLHFRFVVCQVSIEPAIVGLAVVMHRVNPKIHTDGLDKGIRVPFAIEPRWHVWIVQTLLLLFARDFPIALATHCAGLAIGALLTLRDPEVFFDFCGAVRHGSPRIGYVIHLALLFFSLFFMPLTAAELPGDAFSALMDGRALRWSWWREAVPSSPPLLHMGLGGAIAGEALFVCKILISFACPLILSPFRMWLKAYAIACVILAMYAMNSPLWRFPHIGFLVLLYLAWAFWKLPSMEPLKRD